MISLRLTSKRLESCGVGERSGVGLSRPPMCVDELRAVGTEKLCPSWLTMMVLLGDNIRYSISGKVYSLSDVQTSAMAVDAAGIPDATVEVSCPGIENSVYQNRRGVTDQSGCYQLTGYWRLESCEVTFKHHNYEPVRIAI